MVVGNRLSIIGIALLFIPAVITVHSTANRISEMEKHCQVKRVLDPDRATWLYITSWLSIPLLPGFFIPLCFFLAFFFVAEIQDDLNGHWKWHKRMEVEKAPSRQGKAA